MKSFIAFDRNKIYTSLEKPDYNPNDGKLILLLELTHEIGKFGYVLSEDALKYLSESDIQNYFKKIVPVLYNLYYHKDYQGESDLGDPNKYLKDWKSRRREPWIENFYLSGDFRFISESAKSLNLHVTYLDRLSDSGLYNIFKNLIESESDPSDKDMECVKYLSEMFNKNCDDLTPHNTIGNLILGLYDSRRPNKWSDYKLINPNRRERRLILQKLEELDLSKESTKDVKELLKTLHPADYKKIFPKVWKFWSEKKENTKNQTAQELLDAGMVDEFTDRYIGYLYSEISDETDLCTLIYSPKLPAKNLLKIFKNLEKYEMGVPRYHNQSYWCNSSRVVSIIPTIKEFILGRVGFILKDDSFNGKKIYIDPELKKYDFGDTKPRKYEPKTIGKLSGDLENVEFSVLYNSDSCYLLSALYIYLWKGRGKVFKKVVPSTWNEYPALKTEITSKVLNINDIKKRGFKYIVLDNRVIRHGKKGKDLEIKIGNLSIMSRSDIRNSFGGLIDLETLEVQILDCDISEIPTYNGNIQEAIVRYILPEYRFSAYDFMSNYITVSGGDIVEDPRLSGCIKIYPHHYLKKLKEV